jgi:hypothetical protein
VRSIHPTFHPGAEGAILGYVDNPWVCFNWGGPHWDVQLDNGVMGDFLPCEIAVCETPRTINQAAQIALPLNLQTP